MPKHVRDRQIGNLACYLIQKAFSDAAPEKKPHIVVRGNEIYSGMIEVFNDSEKLNDMKSAMKYNESEIAHIESIVRHDGSKSLIRKINKYLKDYSGGGLIPFSGDGSAAFYKLSPMALKILESGGILNNKNMSDR